MINLLILSKDNLLAVDIYKILSFSNVGGVVVLL